MWFERSTSIATLLQEASALVYFWKKPLSGQIVCEESCPSLSCVPKLFSALENIGFHESYPNFGHFCNMWIIMRRSELRQFFTRGFTWRSRTLSMIFFLSLAITPQGAFAVPFSSAFLHELFSHKVHSFLATLKSMIIICIVFELVVFTLRTSQASGLYKENKAQNSVLNIASLAWSVKMTGQRSTWAVISI